VIFLKSGDKVMVLLVYFLIHGIRGGRDPGKKGPSRQRGEHVCIILSSRKLVPNTGNIGKSESCIEERGEVWVLTRRE